MRVIFVRGPWYLVLLGVLLGGCFEAQPTGECSPPSDVPATTLASFPVPLLGSAASPPVGGKIYLVGGCAGTPKGVNWDFYSSVWAYDVATNEVKDLGPVLPYALGAVRRNGIAVGKNGKLYIPPAQGPHFDEGYGFRQCMIEIDPATGRAAERACFPTVRWAPRLVADRDGLIWIFAGWTDYVGAPENYERAVNEIWSYDPATDRLTKASADCGGAQNGMAGDVILESVLGPDGLIYHFDSKNVATFNPADGRFTILGEHRIAGVERAWVGHDGLVHGFVNGYLSSFTMQPGTGKVTEAPLARQATKREDVALSVDPATGHLYLIGGEAGTIERFDCLP
jgi:hypothetical protein